ncbi:MAG TPA: hypothetical protein VN174_02490 [Candidatus Methanoperedens sp.]|nr:hypothetical protein [Candidatus Methanoperedens sp.]
MIGNLSNGGGLMKEEVVRRVIGEMSAGNGDLALVMDYAYKLGRKIVDKLPDNNELALVFCQTRLIRASSYLIGQTIKSQDLLRNPVEYWKTNEAKNAALALADFVTRKDLHKSED